MSDYLPDLDEARKFQCMENVIPDWWDRSSLNPLEPRGSCGRHAS